MERLSHFCFKILFFLFFLLCFSCILLRTTKHISCFLSPFSFETPSPFLSGSRVDYAAVTFSHTHHQPAGLDSGRGGLSSTGGSGISTGGLKAGMGMAAKTTRNRPFADQISCARFYYMDKFVVLVS